MHLEEVSRKKPAKTRLSDLKKIWVYIDGLYNEWREAQPRRKDSILDGAKTYIEKEYGLFHPINYFVDVRDGSFSLGYLLRIRVIQDVLGYSSTKKFASGHEREERLPASESKMDRAFFSDHKTAPVDAANVLTAGFKRVLKARLANESEEDLFEKVFSGPDAPSHFEHWLKKGRTKLYDRFEHLDDRRAAKFLADANDLRETLLEKISDDLFPCPGSAPETAQRMLYNYYGAGMWGGLSSLAKWILEERDRRNSEIEICYIPLIRSKMSGGLSLPDFVAHITSFYKGEPAGRAKAPPETAAELAAQLDAIRLAMAEKPGILIFDGYSDADIGFKNIGRTIADNHVLDIIARLLEPPVVTDDEVFDLATFERNRIVILSDEDLSESAKSHDAPDLLVAHDPEPRLVPSPDASKMMQIIEWQGLAHKDDIKILRERIPGLSKETSEAVFAALSALLSAQLTPSCKHFPEAATSVVRHAEVIKGIVTLLGKEEGSQRLLAIIVKELLKRIGDLDKEAEFILLIIAFAPGGVRRATLVRILRRWRQTKMLGPKDRKSPLSSYQGHEDVDAKLDALLDRFGSIVAAQRDDFFEEYDDSPPTFDPIMTTQPRIEMHYDRASKRVGALDFTIPEIRRTLTAMSALGVRRHLRLIIHRFLAEENLAQQTIALRHSQKENEGSLRFYRRLVAGIYHALCSIPFSTEGKLANFPCKPPNSGIPICPDETWTWVAGYCYQRLLERVPEYRMSRVFAADMTKLEILMKLERPWLDDFKSARDQRLKASRSSDTIFYRVIADFEKRTPHAAEAARVRYGQLALEHALSLAQTEFLIGERRSTNQKPQETALKQRQRVQRKLPWAGAESSDSDGDEAEFRWTEEDLRIAKRRLDYYLSKADEKNLERLFNAIKPVIDRQVSVNVIKEDVRRNASMADGGDCSSIAAFIDNLTSRFRELTESRNFAPGVTDEIDPDLFSGVSSTTVSTKDGKPLSGKMQSYLCAILLRKAEYLAVNADIEEGRAKLNGDEAPETATRIGRQFSKALATFVLAEQIRLNIFDQDAFGDKYFLSGHSVRTMIRTCLKLEQLSRRRSAADHTQVSNGLFSIYARRMADLWARGLHRFDRERASMLTMEATIWRIATPKPQLSRLRICLQFLREAEPLSLTLGTTSRAHMRFLLERAKVYRRLAIYFAASEYACCHFSPEKSDHFRELARRDIAMLDRLTEHHDIKFWRILVDLQKQAFDKDFPLGSLRYGERLNMVATGVAV